jgi:hypothetical protein
VYGEGTVVSGEVYSEGAATMDDTTVVGEGPAVEDGAPVMME